MISGTHTDNNGSTDGIASSESYIVVLKYNGYRRTDVTRTRESSVGIFIEAVKRIS